MLPDVGYEHTLETSGPTIEDVPPTALFLSNPALWSSDINKYNLGLEIEQWAIPQGYRPDVGDRVIITGRLIADCGHDWHNELHPMELIVSSYLQLAKFFPLR